MATFKARDQLPLILASIFIAFVIWLIARQTDLDRDRLSARVVIENLPNYMTIEAPDRVWITVQYPSQLGNQVLEKNFWLPINAGKIFDTDTKSWKLPAAPQEKELPLRPGDVRSSADPTVQVIGIDPHIRLAARLNVRELAVRVETTGTLPAHLKLAGEIKPAPNELFVTGPPEALNKFAPPKNTLSTEPIDLSTLQGSGQFYPNVHVPEGLILLGRPNRQIAVSIAVTERPSTLTLRDVPVSLMTYAENLKIQTRPSTVDVVIEGPDSAIRTIKADDIAFSLARELPEQLGPPQQLGLEARLKNTVPADVARQTRVVEVRPPRISVEFVPAIEQNKR